MMKKGEASASSIEKKVGREIQGGRTNVGRQGNGNNTPHKFRFKKL
jgi:hypothetical protein